jgi:hypothetical protein
MKALNRNEPTFKMFVYLENALDISSYSPVFQYNGKSMEELEAMVFQFLNISNKNKIRICVYTGRVGYLKRKILSSLNAAPEEVYIVLKRVEDGNQ